MTRAGQADKTAITSADIEATLEAAERAFPGMTQAMADAGNAPGAFYDTYKQAAGPMLRALGEVETSPDATRAGLLPPHQLADFKRPSSWASIPIHCVDDFKQLKEAIRALEALDAYSWINPRGDTYIVPGRYNRDTVVTVTGSDPNTWICGCAQGHDTEFLCWPVLQVALIRGDLIRRNREVAP